MAPKILAAFGVLSLGFVAFVATRPSHFAIERKATIAAAPAALYAAVSDFHEWQKWSPWEELDPKMTRTHEGAPAGTGAIYKWKGNDEVGEGQLTITEAKPAERVVIKLELTKPFAATHTTTLTFNPGPQTEVVWKIEGENGFMSKTFGVFVNMDKMVGDDFDKGLGKLKKLAEAAPAPAAAPPPAEGTADAGAQP